MHLKAGETVTVRELLDGMAVASGNDACVAMAEHLGGTDAFIRRMNRKARELGMTSTTFETTNGLPSPGQYTTARDMMKLSVSYLKRFPQSLEHHSKTVITHRGRNRYNSNELLQNCDGVDGIKTGWVAASGYNIVTTAKRGDSRIIAVVLGGRSWQIRNRETKKIMEACFTPAGQKTYLAQKSETSAKQRPGSARLELADPSARASFGQPPRNQGSPLPGQGPFDDAQATVVPMSGPELRAVAAPPPAKPAIAAASARSAPPPFSPKPFQPDAAAYQPDSLPEPRTVAENAATEASRGELTIQESSWKNPDEAQARVRLLESKGVSPGWSQPIWETWESGTG
jgi:D-alanyl-D-alanine carboxypeptidase